MTADVVELDIHGIAAGGDGVGRADGLVVFAPRTAAAPISARSSGESATDGASSTIF